MIKEFSSHSNCLLPRGNNNNPIKYSPLLTEAHLVLLSSYNLFHNRKESISSPSFTDEPQSHSGGHSVLMVFASK